MRILGAEKIHTFARYFHPDLEKISKYYEQQDFLEVLPFKEPSGVSNAKLHVRDSLFLELSVVNDCFYRVRNLYDYIAILDTDEIFLPVKTSDNDWHDLLKNFEDFPKTDGYAIRSVMYPPRDGKVHDSIPEYYYMLQRTQVSLRIFLNFLPTQKCLKNFSSELSSIKTFQVPFSTANPS